MIPNPRAVEEDDLPDRVARALGVPVTELPEQEDRTMSRRIVAGTAIVCVIVGLLAGYLMWGQSSRQLTDDLARVKGRLTEQTQRADFLQSQLTDIKAALKRSAEDLKSERETRQRLETILTKGRK